MPPVVEKSSPSQFQNNRAVKVDGEASTHLPRKSRKPENVRTPDAAFPAASACPNRRPFSSASRPGTFSARWCNHAKSHTSANCHGLATYKGKTKNAPRLGQSGGSRNEPISIRRPNLGTKPVVHFSRRSQCETSLALISQPHEINMGGGFISWVEHLLMHSTESKRNVHILPPPVQSPPKALFLPRSSGRRSRTATHVLVHRGHLHRDRRLRGRRLPSFEIAAQA